MKKYISVLLILVLALQISVFAEDNPVWTQTSGNFQFQWDIEKDMAKTIKQPDGQQIWNGSLLPAFLIKDQNGNKQYLKASVDVQNKIEGDNLVEFQLKFGDLATGQLTVSKTDWGVSFDRLTVSWINEVPEIIDMYFGTSPVSGDGLTMLNADELPYRGNWSAAGFCVPGAKEGTAQSFFRMWDFGQSTLALGSYGPSLGSLYGAAFPKPVLAFAMGSDQGWTAFGAGSIPDAAMLMKLQTTKGCLQYLYREDLWGAGAKERVWEQPLRITFGETAWTALKSYTNSFSPKEANLNIKQQSIWNTWGNWKNKEYPIRPMVDFAEKVGVELFVVDDPWEESQGLGRPSFERFPNFYEDFAYIEENGMQRGIWETLGWITDTVKAELTSDDLILNKNGVPCKASWSFSPFDGGSYCIDISSARSREFLRQRTIWTMENIKPKLIKLDFGYGMPSPNMGVPRDPAIRGERYSYELFKLIVAVAKSIDPNVIIMYYGVNPLYLSLVDMISLDDQGDLWYAMKQGHDEWSMWASLVSNQVAISGSSSYDWHTDDEVVFNSFILGTPGAVLATHLDDGSAVPEKYLNRRLALNTWYRRTVGWKPIWLNSHLGDLSQPPVIRCWGRSENFDGKEVVTALALSGEKDRALQTLSPFEWDGRWMIVSQTNEDILKTKKLTVTPFDEGFISIQLSGKPSSVEKLNLEGTSVFSQWNWENGKLTIQVSEEELSNIAGFIINR